jgi:Domain of unknown function (DUF4349)
MRTHRPERAEGPLDPLIAADLGVVDRVLGGRTAPTDPADADFAELVALLRDERPTPDGRWADGLDERAAAGFPRGGGRGPEGPKGRRRSSFFGAGGWMVPAGAVATLAVVVVIATSNLGGGASDSVSSDSATTSSPAAAGSSAAPEVSQDSGLSGAAEQAYPDQGAFDRRDSTKIAPGTENRKVDRSTQLKLSAKPQDVRGVSDEVISITRSLDGIVASSQVSESKGVSTATLELTLPTRNVDAALDRMTDLADVDSLNETTDDITKPFVSAQDQVKDAKAKRKELLEALGNATTDAEAQALTIRIADARREIARAQAAFDRIARKARLSDLSVTVTSNPNATDERTLGDWFDDAVDVLRGIAGVLLVSAAILVPLGLIAAMAAFITSRLRRRSRERSLD